jgi:hypothetical protein
MRRKRIGWLPVIVIVLVGLGHSFQFHFDAATTSQFWKRVVDETGMDTVSKPRNP